MAHSILISEDKGMIRDYQIYLRKVFSESKMSGVVEISNAKYESFLQMLSDDSMSICEVVEKYYSHISSFEQALSDWTHPETTEIRKKFFDLTHKLLAFTIETNAKFKKIASGR